MTKEQILLDALDQIIEAPLPANESEMWSWIHTARNISNAALSQYNEGESSAKDEHPHQSIFDQYHDLKEKIGELGYNNFIHSKEVEEYRAWLRNDKYKHRLDWFEKEYPNGLYYKDEDGTEYGVSLMTKKFLAEADAAYNEGVVQEPVTYKMPQWLAEKLLQIRDAIVKERIDEAYHVLYSIASPKFDKLEPWQELEKIAAEGKGEEKEVQP